MSDAETAMAVAAAIAALQDDDDGSKADTGNGHNEVESNCGEVDGEGEAEGVTKEEPMEVEKPPPKPKTKVLSCLICTKPVTDDNTQLGCSNSSDEYEQTMKVVCKLLCVDSHPLLKHYQFRHSEEPKKLCCDECCEVIFNLGSLQSIIDRTKVAINKKLDWILKTVSDSAAEKSEEIEKVFFSAKSDVFRAEVLQVCERKNNAKNGNAESDEEEEELVNKGVQTDISGESGVSDVTTKAGLKSYERPSFSFEDNNMDTYSDHNDDMPYNNSYENDDDDSKLSSAKKSYSSSSNSKSTANKRGRPSGSGTKRAKFLDSDDDDDIEILEEKKTAKGRGRQPAKPKVDARELLKVEFSSESGRPKRSTAAKRPNYQILAGDEDDDYTPASKRGAASTADSLSRNKKPPARKEVSLSAIPIVKDASGKTYFEGVEIVRTDKSITCKHHSCYYVVDGSGYNAFERIKAHIHDNHIGDKALPDIY